MCVHLKTTDRSASSRAFWSTAYFRDRSLEVAGSLLVFRSIVDVGYGLAFVFFIEVLCDARVGLCCSANDVRCEGGCVIVADRLVVCGQLFLVFVSVLVRLLRAL